MSLLAWERPSAPPLGAEDVSSPEDGSPPGSVTPEAAVHGDSCCRVTHQPPRAGWFSFVMFIIKGVHCAWGAFVFPASVISVPYSMAWPSFSSFVSQGWRIVLGSCR